MNEKEYTEKPALGDGRPQITLRALNKTAAAWLGTDAEVALYAVLARKDDLGADVDKLAVQVEKLIAERERVKAILRTFMNAPITLSSLQPLLDLAQSMLGGSR